MKGQDVRVGASVKIWEYPLAENGESEKAIVKELLGFGVFENFRVYNIMTESGEVRRVLSNEEAFADTQR